MSYFGTPHKPDQAKRTSWHGDLATAVAAAGSTETTIIVDASETTTANIDIPINVTLRFEEGAIVTVGAGYYLKHVGDVECPRVQCFARASGGLYGTSVIALRCTEIYPEWFYGRTDRDYLTSLTETLTSSGAQGSAGSVVQATKVLTDASATFQTKNVDTTATFNVVTGTNVDTSTTETHSIASVDTEATLTLSTDCTNGSDASSIRYYIGDGSCADHTADHEFTSLNGGFTSDHVDRYLWVLNRGKSGNAIPGTYKITARNSTTSIDLDGDPTNGTNETGILWTIPNPGGALNDAILAASTETGSGYSNYQGGKVTLGSGQWLLRGPIWFPGYGVTLEGTGIENNSTRLNYQGHNWLGHLVDCNGSSAGGIMRGILLTQGGYGGYQSRNTVNGRAFANGEMSQCWLTGGRYFTMDIRGSGMENSIYHSNVFYSTNMAIPEMAHVGICDAANDMYFYQNQFNKAQRCLWAGYDTSAAKESNRNVFRDNIFAGSDTTVTSSTNTICAVHLADCHSWQFADNRFEHNRICFRFDTGADHISIRGGYYDDTLSVIDYDYGLGPSVCVSGSGYSLTKKATCDQYDCIHGPNLLPNGGFEKWDTSSNLEGWSAASGTNWDAGASSTYASAVTPNARTDGACADHTTPYTFTSAVGGFRGLHDGSTIRVTGTGSGGNAVVGTYTVDSVTSDTSVDLTSDPTDGTNETAIPFTVPIASGSTFACKIGDGSNADRGIATPAFQVREGASYMFTIMIGADETMGDHQVEVGYRMLDDNGDTVSTGTLFGHNIRWQKEFSNHQGSASSSYESAIAAHEHTVSVATSSAMYNRGHSFRIPMKQGITSMRLAILSGSVDPTLYTIVDDVFLGEGSAPVMPLHTHQKHLVDGHDQDVYGQLTLKGGYVDNTVTLSAVGPTDNLNVAGVNTVYLDSSSNSVTLGGLVGGVTGQPLRLVRTSTLNTVTIEDTEGGGNQDILLQSETDQASTSLGGWDLSYNGSNWYEVGTQGEVFVSRDPGASADFDQSGLTEDGATRDLDVSGIVPAAGRGKLVHFGCHVAHSAQRALTIKEKAHTGAYGGSSIACDAGGTAYGLITAVCDASGLVSYTFTGTVTTAFINVIGWWQDSK